MELDSVLYEAQYYMELKRSKLETLTKRVSLDFRLPFRRMSLCNCLLSVFTPVFTNPLNSESE